MQKSLLIAICFTLLSIPLAEAQQIRNGGLTGQIQSFRRSVPGNNGSVDVLTTPVGNKAGFFILTQFCTNSHQIKLQGNTLGVISNIREQASPDFCNNYSPGFAVPQDETLTCKNEINSTSFFCILTGVQSKR